MCVDAAICSQPAVPGMRDSLLSECVQTMQGVSGPAMCGKAAHTRGHHKAFFHTAIYSVIQICNNIKNLTALCLGIISWLTKRLLAFKYKATKRCKR